MQIHGKKRETLPVPTMEVWHYLMSFAWGWFSIKTYQDIVVLAFSLLTQVITLNVNKNPHDSDPCVTVPMKIVLCNVVRLTNEAVWQVSTLAQLSQQPEIPPSYQRSLPTTRHQCVKVNFAIEFVRKTYDIWFNDKIWYIFMTKFMFIDEFLSSSAIMSGAPGATWHDAVTAHARRGLICPSYCNSFQRIIGNPKIHYMETRCWMVFELVNKEVFDRQTVKPSYPNTWLPMGPGQSCFCSQVQFMCLAICKPTQPLHSVCNTHSCSKS